MNYYNLISMMPKAVAYDADAQAFITATGISGTNASAINTLVIDLKAASIWTKMKAIYPIVGGTATAHKFNLKNPLDTDAAFRLSFVGGWTHSATGMLPNGINTYANTFFIPVTHLSINNAHISHYSRTNNNTFSIDIGSQQLFGTPSLVVGGTSTFSFYRINDYTFDYPLTTNSFGFRLGSRNSATNKKMIVNNTVTNVLTNSTGIPNQSLIIGAYQDNGAINYYSYRECAFASIGDGLTDAEALAFYNAVQTYQTTLGRQV